MTVGHRPYGLFYAWVTEISFGIVPILPAGPSKSYDPMDPFMPQIKEFLKVALSYAASSIALTIDHALEWLLVRTLDQTI